MTPLTLVTSGQEFVRRTLRVFGIFARPGYNITLQPLVRSSVLLFSWVQGGYGSDDEGSCQQEPSAKSDQASWRCGVDVLAAHHAGERSHCVTEPDARNWKDQEHAALEGGLTTAVKRSGGEVRDCDQERYDFPDPFVFLARTTKVTGRRPKTSDSKKAPSAAPVDRLVRRRTLGHSPSITPHHQAPRHHLRKPSCIPPIANENALALLHPCPSVVPLAIVVPTAVTKRNSTTRKNSRCRLPTHRHERSLGRRTSTVPT